MGELSILKDLGDIAGVPGIALGVALLLFRGVIANALKLESNQAFRLLRHCTIGALVIGVVGIAASLYATEGANKSNTTYAPNSPIVEKTDGPVSINIQNAPQPRNPGEHEPNESTPSATIPEGAATAPSNTTITHGANSPIVKDTKGGVSIQIGPSTDAPK